jgi:hypothetical protein
MALGSVAERLLRCASHPVLTVANEFDRLTAEAHETNKPRTDRETP